MKKLYVCFYFTFFVIAYQLLVTNSPLLYHLHDHLLWFNVSVTFIAWSVVVGFSGHYVSASYNKNSCIIVWYCTMTECRICTQLYGLNEFLPCLWNFNEFNLATENAYRIIYSPFWWWFPTLPFCGIGFFINWLFQQSEPRAVVLWRYKVFFFLITYSIVYYALAFVLFHSIWMAKCKRMLLIPGTGNGERGTGNGSLGTSVQR